MNELALFAGAGGGILGGHLLGWRTVCAVEIEPYPAGVLLAKQNEKILPPFPIWDDICTFDGRAWRGHVDVVSGGFPCQDISSAGKGAGIEGAKSGLWREMHRVICEVRPTYAFMENSPCLTTRGLGRVLGDLAASGYNAEWMVLGADELGAPHIRKRMWILAIDTAPGMADSNRQRKQQPQGEFTESRGWIGYGSQEGHVADTDLPRCRQGVPGPLQAKDHHSQRVRWDGRKWWTSEPGMGRMAHGLAHRVDRVKALGNGQVPIVAATAFRLLHYRLTGLHYDEATA